MKFFDDYITGLLEGMEAEKQELEEAIANSEVGRHDLATELSAVQERLEELESEQKNFHEEKEQLEQQKEVIAAKLGADDLGMYFIQHVAQYGINMFQKSLSILDQTMKADGDLFEIFVV